MQTKKQQIINLWQSVFDDTPEFIRLFFDRIYSDENALSFEKDGQVVSALHMLPYSMTYLGKEVPVSYIYGACTLESERGKGYMAELLERAFDLMRERGIAFTVLIPAESWLFNYYHRFGYAVCFNYSVETYEREILPAYTSTQVITGAKDCMDEVCRFLDQKQQQRICYVLHTKDDWMANYSDLLSSGGELLIARERGAICGVAFALPSLDKRIIIQEMFYDSQSVKEDLLLEASVFFNSDTVECRIPPKEDQSVPFGMARIIDRDGMIKLWRNQHPEDNLAELEKANDSSLCQYLLQYQQKIGYMSLMFD